MVVWAKAASELASIKPASIRIAEQRRPSGEAKRANEDEDEVVMLIPPNGDNRCADCAAASCTSLAVTRMSLLRLMFQKVSENGEKKSCG
jgi:hypothetical protein